MPDISKCASLYNSVKDIPIIDIIPEGNNAILDMLNKQNATQEFICPKRSQKTPNDFTTDAYGVSRIEKSLYYYGCLTVEFAELMEWLPELKASRQYPGKTDEVILEMQYELIDMWHFLMNFMLYITPNMEIYEFAKIDNLFTSEEDPEDNIGNLMFGDVHCLSDSAAKLWIAIGEVINLLPYKCWKTYSNFQDEFEKVKLQYQEKTFDVLFYFIKLCELFGIRKDLFIRLYYSKNLENFNRQKEGGKYFV